MSEGYWWCPRCRLEVDPRNVTYEELHDACGTAVVAVEPAMSAPDPVRELAEEIADALVECSCNPEERWILESRDDYKGRAVDEWEARLRSLLEERESHWRRLAETPNAALTAALAEAAGLRGAVRLTAKVVGDDGRVFGEEEAPDEA